MKEIEMEGKTVTIAVENGLEEIGLRRDQVEVEVLNEGNTGFLGIGSKPALVRLREKKWGPDDGDTGSEKTAPAAPRTRRPNKPAQTAGHDGSLSAKEAEKACRATEEILSEILKLAELEKTSLNCSWDCEQNRVRAEIDSPDGNILIGKGGRTIEALQFLLTVMVGRKTGTPAAIQVETEGYWKKIEGKILEEAEKAVGDVVRSGKPYRFEPLEPSLRRLIHRKLSGHPDVVTSSEGEGPWRKVVIKPSRD